VCLPFDIYADVLVFFVSSSKLLSILLSVCLQCSSSYDIKYTSTKTNVMFLDCKNFKDVYIPN